MSRVALILPYFGRLPAYFPLFLRSCSRNPGFDFLIFTDDPDAGTPPANVRIVFTSLAALGELIREKLGVRVLIPRPYKLCDYKAAFGRIFEDYLRGYTHWGHCDADMILGDLSAFIGPERLDAYDKLLVNGHLTLYRNTPRVNGYYLLTAPGEPSFDQVIGRAEVCYFDEIGMTRILDAHGVPQYRDFRFADILPQYPSFRLSPICRARNARRQVFLWRDGKTLRLSGRAGSLRADEFMYIHIQKRVLPVHGADVLTAPSFYITPLGFFDGSAEAEDRMKDINWKHLLSYYRRRWSGLSLRKITGKVARTVRHLAYRRRITYCV